MLYNGNNDRLARALGERRPLWRVVGPVGAAALLGVATAFASAQAQNFDRDGTVSRPPATEQIPKTVTHPPGVGALTLVAPENMLGIGDDRLVVELWLHDAQADIVGGQFLLWYDTQKLDLLVCEPGEAPFVDEKMEWVNEPTGTLVYATGVLPGESGGTHAECMMARFEFLIVPEVEACAEAGLVAFRDPLIGEQPTVITDESGRLIAPELTDLAEVTIDISPPTFMTLPSCIVETNAVAGTCLGDVSLRSPTAYDDCTPDEEIVISSVRTDEEDLTVEDPFPVGTTVFFWLATDASGNTTASPPYCVIVHPVNEMLVEVELQHINVPVSTSPECMFGFSRCITFDLYPRDEGPPVRVEKLMWFTRDFDANVLSSAAIEVPCGDYIAVSARDRLHTLGRTIWRKDGTTNADFYVHEGVYSVDFTRFGPEDDQLLGGNANNDNCVDILDFGLVMSEWGAYPYPDPWNTDCDTPAPHCDFTFDGVVDHQDEEMVFDYNYFMVDEPTPLDFWGSEAADETRGELPEGPIAAITVAQLHRLGLDQLEAGDLNNDEVLDEGDLIAFFKGARPHRAADLNGDNVVDALDLEIVIASIGCEAPLPDIDKSGTVDAGDVAFVIDRMGMRFNLR